MTAQIALRELFEGNHAVSFEARPEPIPGDLRLAWRLPVLSMILEKCRGQRTSLRALNVLWWAIRASDSRSQLLGWLAGVHGPDDVLIRYDPSLTSTLDLALGEHLVELVGDVVRLTPKGKVLALQAISAPALEGEKEFLAGFHGKITQAQIHSLLEWK